MGKNPYSDLPKSAFWKTGVAQENPYAIEGIYKKKFKIPPKARIATAGSCFAQHISRYLKKNGYNLLDVEPPPPGLPKNLHQMFGFSMYSARYGNIYTVRQLLQLAKEAAGEWAPQNYIWKKKGKFYDALRPAVEPGGLDTSEEVTEHRKFHISRVKELFKNLDFFIFTLGLTEMWVHKDSGTVYPTSPGTLAGDFDGDIFEFQNPHFGFINNDMSEFVQVLRRIRGGRDFKMILTVSPVPLTATASERHVLAATMYSKSTLRSIAGLWADKPFVDYFPSYELVTNPRMSSCGFSHNLRSVRDETVETVMKHFFAEHPIIKSISKSSNSQRSLPQKIDDVQCEEALLEAFGK
uniref:GSCFA domain-containing protein n=1 Tax=Synechococcus sp. UW106 TaxID=368495 RepID=UPI000E0FBDEF|nr:GSCFA domain-containing protein [Synechococcus sp. UW106]